MKYFFTVLFVSIATILRAQDEHINEARITRQNMSLQECDYLGSTSNLNRKPIPVGAKFTIIKKNAKNDYIINFWDWNDNLTAADETEYAATTEANYKSKAVYTGADEETQKYLDLNYRPSGEARYFILPATTLNDVSKVLYRRWSPTGGALTFPFKYRPQTGVFEKTFSLSFVGGAKWLPRRTNDDFSISGMIGVGASSITLTRDNTVASSGVTDATDRTAVTISGNLVIQWEKFQLAFSGGIDNKLDGNKEQWDFQGKGWLCVGVGIGIFSNSEVKSPGKN